MAGPFADKLPEALVHPSGVTFSQKSPSFRLQYGDEIPDTDQRIILVTFLCRERSFGAFVGQFFDPTLHLRFGM
jgi:hypothetical protein